MIRLFFKAFFLLIFLYSFVSFAQEPNKVHLSLIADSQNVGDEPVLLMGLRAQLAPGWKTYWRTPGVAGYGVNLIWEGSKNIKSAHILWPLPCRIFTQMGQVNAYEGDVIFPLLVKRVDSTQDVQAVIHVDMLVCNEANCLPIMETLKLNLPKGPKKESSQSVLLQQALAKVPHHYAADQSLPQSLHVETPKIIDADTKFPAIQVTLFKNQGIFSPLDLPELFLEMKDLVVDTPMVSLSEDQKSIRYIARIYPDAHHAPTHLPNLNGQPVLLTIGYQNDAIEIKQNLQTPSLNLYLLGLMLFVAFVGGLILNIMPCVLPVLSLKVLSVVRHGGGHNATVRQEFLATVLGIIFSFFILASATMLLKASGHIVGWGVQFQQPYFLIGLVGILTLFTCNLFGFFEFHLPSFLSSLGNFSLHRESLVSSFLEGSLVTVLATPCTAPFLGTALAFAFSRGPFEIMSIFLAMGVGLAFPFLLIASFPKFATRLPKPGAWMHTLKKALGCIIMITALWLTYILVAEVGLLSAFLVAVSMAIIILTLARTRHTSSNQRRKVWLGVSLLILVTFTLPLLLPQPTSAIASQQQHSFWRPFNPDRIDAYLKAGKTVFVSVTADWCLTCQANKYFVLKSQRLLSALQQENVIAMEADWTNHAPQIAAYLKTFNQYGIPFYAIYGCASPKGRFLGQILTPAKVLDALNQEKCSIQPSQ